MAKITAEQLKNEFKLVVKAEFVPWSKSRSFDEKIGRDVSKKNLNWRVTLQKHNDDARFEQNRVIDIITTEYSAGIGHAPSYNAKNMGVRFSMMHAECLEKEIETGKFYASSQTDKTLIGKPGKWCAILPDPADVVYSLVQDGSAIDSPTYEDWAADMGFDADSRKGEAIYRQCLEIGLKLRAGLGEENLAKLRELFQDY
jgi:hypothetical protein